MTRLNEATSLEQVAHGLSVRFAAIPPDTVRAVVAEVLAAFDGPVRDYVPLLVERVSRDRLRELSKGGDRRQLGGSGPGTG